MPMSTIHRVEEERDLRHIVFAALKMNRDFLT